MKFKAICVLCFMLVLPAFAAETAFDRDGVISIELSPSGQHFGVLTRRMDTDTLIIFSVRDDSVVLQIERKAPSRMGSIRWLDDAQLIVEPSRDIDDAIQPQSDGSIELLGLDGSITSSNDIDQSALSDQQLYLVDPLPLSPELMVVESAPNAGLWLVDNNFRVVQEIDYPALTSTRFRISPNSRFVAVTGLDEDQAIQSMVLENMPREEWRILDVPIDPLSVTNAGTVYGLLPDESGIVGLVSLNWESARAELLFRDSEHNVDHVMFNANGDPYAVRYLPGYPSWQYVGVESNLGHLHKSMRAALPDYDIEFASISITDRRAIARIRYDHQPDNFFLLEVAAGQARHLLGSSAGLHVTGGEAGDAYFKQPFTVQGRSGAEITGFIRSPTETYRNPRRTIVYLGEGLKNDRWKWGYDEEVVYLNRLGLSVLMIDPSDTRGEAAQNVEDAIRWSIDNGFSDDDRVCLLGRGEGAEVALQVAVRNEDYECAVIFGGYFGSADQFTNASDNVDLDDLSVLFISGDRQQEEVNADQAVQDFLRAHETSVEIFIVEGEGRVFSRQTSEVRALARMTGFLIDQFGASRRNAPLPMTYDQAAVVSDIFSEFNERAGRNSANSFNTVNNAKRWLAARDPSMQRVFSEEQWPLYQAISDGISTFVGSIEFGVPPEPGGGSEFERVND